MVFRIVQSLGMDAMRLEKTRMLFTDRYSTLPGKSFVTAPHLQSRYNVSSCHQLTQRLYEMSKLPNCRIDIISCLPFKMMDMDIIFIFMPLA